MTQLQQKTFDLLRVFLSICQTLKLPYYLVCGSALGAAKYGGFIPWDDDVDVALPRESYRLFLEQAPALLPEYLFLQTYETDPAFPMLSAKLRDTRTTFAEESSAHLPMCHGVYLDIFPLDGYPKGRFSQAVFEIRKKFYTFQANSAFRVERSLPAAAVNRVMCLLGYPRRTAQVLRRYTAMISRYPIADSDFICNHGNWQGRLEYAPKAQYGDGIYATFEGLSVVIPADFDGYLTQKYGAWREELPLEQQHSHHRAAFCDLSRPCADYDGRKILLLSNYFNHHQKPLCDALFARTGGRFVFLETGEMSPERKDLGYGQAPKPAYVHRWEKHWQKAVLGADLVIYGSAPEKLLQRRLFAGKQTLRYSERIYKEPAPRWQLPLRTLKYFCQFGIHKNLSLLAVGAYTAADYAQTGAFRGKAYQWGYFPAVPPTLSEPKNEKLTILWAGRMIDWKHPALALKLAQRLHGAGIPFELNFLGTGPLEAPLRAENRLEEVHFLGAVPAEEVGSYMEKAHIFLATGDRREGWGAVVSEAMGRGCAVVANQACGSGPWLIRQGETGFLYETEAAFFQYAMELAQKPELCKPIGQAARNTMLDTWNAEEAARRLLALTARREVFHAGPCSRAERSQP